MVGSCFKYVCAKIHDGDREANYKKNVFSENRSFRQKRILDNTHVLPAQGAIKRGCTRCKVSRFKVLDPKYYEKRRKTNVVVVRIIGPRLHDLTATSDCQGLPAHFTIRWVKDPGLARDLW